MEDRSELIFASVSDRGLSEKRPQNEDSFAVLPQFGVFAVADGVGGAQAGDFASQMAMELLTEAVTNRRDTVDAEELFRVAISHANISIHQMAVDVPQLSSMATTIVALQLNKNIATVAHVGDSRIYRFSPDGKVFRETDDHSVVEEEVRAGRMTPEQAAVHPSRNVISRALGAEDSVNIDVKTIMVEPGTTFLLCSDGITRHIPDAELKIIFASNAQPQLICDHLKELCYSRGAEDNLTAVIVRTFAEAEKTEPADDFLSTVPVIEEETIASARSAFAGSVNETQEVGIADTLAEIDIDEADIPPVEEVTAFDEPQIVEPIPQAEVVTETPVDQLPTLETEADTDEQYLLTETEVLEETIPEEPKDLSTYTSSSVVVPAQTPPPAVERDYGMFGTQPYDDDHTPAGGGFGRILISLGLLALGAVIAVALTYFLGLGGRTEQVPAPQVETMKSQNIPLTTFEESRRTVDKDPAAYASVAPTANDASDFYLRGRALLLIGKTDEARIQFQQARDRLAVVDDAERKTLRNEIALALAVVESPQATEAFKKAVADAQVGTAANSNVPVR